jgi:hypothetical protein
VTGRPIIRDSHPLLRLISRCLPVNSAPSSSRSFIVCNLTTAHACTADVVSHHGVLPTRFDSHISLSQWTKTRSPVCSACWRPACVSAISRGQKCSPEAPSGLAAFVVADPARPRSTVGAKPSLPCLQTSARGYVLRESAHWIALWTMRRSYLPTAQCASPEMGSIIMEALQPMSRHTFSSVKQSCILILSLIASARRFALERRARGICPAQVQPSAHVHTLGYCSFSQTIAGSIRVQMRSCDNDTCVRVRSCSYCKPSI